MNVTQLMGDLDDCQILLEKVETIFHEELEAEETGRTDMKFFSKFSLKKYVLIAFRNNTAFCTGLVTL